MNKTSINLTKKYILKIFYLSLIFYLFSSISLQSKEKLKLASSKELKKNAGVPLDTKKIINKIAFGSCSHQDHKKYTFLNVEADKPDIWIWLGDTIYADTEDNIFKQTIYNSLLGDWDYQKVLKTSSILGTWDDHDYGVNDSGKEFPEKVVSQQLFLDFIGEPKDSKRRKRKGIYDSYTIGPKGKQVKIYLLDTRYHRDSPSKNNGTILGKDQWSWLEKEFKNSNADINIICSSIQIIPTEQKYEKWANFPSERKRLLSLISKAKKKGVILISGDRHIGEISRLDIEELGYPLFEITSSGITKGAKDRLKNEINSLRASDQIGQNHFAHLEIKWGKDDLPTRVDMRIIGSYGKVMAKNFLYVKSK